MDYTTFIEKRFHDDILSKLEVYSQDKEMPNIIFHGKKGSGKLFLMRYLLEHIYKEEHFLKNYVLYVNCNEGKGIKFIREELKFFAKMNVEKHENIPFKSIVLLDSDHLTIDAQSALRRCIELFSHTTRFFMLVENKVRLLKPILSRFSTIYVPYPEIEGGRKNIHQYKKTSLPRTIQKVHRENIEEVFKKHTPVVKREHLFQDIEKLYQNGVSGYDLMNYIKEFGEEDTKKYELLIHLDKIRKEVHHEKLFMFHILVFYSIRNNIHLENISTM